MSTKSRGGKAWKCDKAEDTLMGSPLIWKFELMEKMINFTLKTKENNEVLIMSQT